MQLKLSYFDKRSTELTPKAQYDALATLSLLGISTLLNTSSSVIPVTRGLRVKFNTFDLTPFSLYEFLPLAGFLGINIIFPENDSRLSL